MNEHPKSRMADAYRSGGTYRFRVRFFCGTALLTTLSACADTSGTCAQCVLELLPSVDLFANERDVAFVNGTRVTVTRGGTLYLAPLANRSRIASYSASGELLGTVGAAGPGPGEFEYVVRTFALNDDSVLVVDRAGQVEVLAPSGAPARTFNAIFEIGSLGEAGNGRFLAIAGASGEVFDLERTGRVRGSFIKEAVGGADPLTRWHMHIADNGEVWLASSDYRVRSFDAAGNELVSLVGDLDELRGRRLFQSRDRYSVGVADIVPISGTYVAILISTRDSEWTPARPQAGGGAPQQLTPTESNELHDFYLDLVDRRTGLWVKRFTVPQSGLPVGFTNDGRLVTIEEDETHPLFIRLWRVLIHEQRD